MLISHIIQVLLCIPHQLIFIFHFFSSTHFPPLWIVDAMFIFIKVFISSYFRSVWHPFSCFILRIVYFVLCCVTSLGPSHFPSCSSHTVHDGNCIRNMSHNAVNTRSQILLHRKFTCTLPVRQMPFGITTLKIEDYKGPQSLTSVQCSCIPVSHPQLN